MSSQPPRLSLLSPDQRKAAIDSIINYFATERDEEIGIIAAEALLDFFLDEMGKDIHNNSVTQTQKFYQDRLEQIEADIEINLKQND